MLPKQNPRRRWLVRGLVFGMWTLLGIALTGQAALVISSALRAASELPKQIPDPPWSELLSINLAECYIWGLLAIGVFWLGRRFPFVQGRWQQSLVVHVGACVVVAFVESGLSALANDLLRREIVKPTVTPRVLEFFFIIKFPQNLFVYWVILGVSQALDYYRKFRERELRTSQLEAKLAHAQLQVLKMQLQPHFLFNTLNAISALIHHDVEVADRMIARLGDLLRSTLENANQQEVSLQQELDFIRPYLEIEQARLGSRLKVTIDIDAGTLDAAVPNLLLQPLVENSIRHGIAPRAADGAIEIRSWRENGMLHLQVRDDGPGLGSKCSPLKEGMGLGNTRARLQHLYGDSHGFELINGAGQGLAIRMTIPYRQYSAPAGSPSA
jgi:signal transduction histidine kinase